jgi:hypothetical protein
MDARVPEDIRSTDGMTIATITFSGAKNRQHRHAKLDMLDITQTNFHADCRSLRGGMGGPIPFR